MSVCAAPTCSHQSFDGSSYYVDVDVERLTLHGCGLGSVARSGASVSRFQQNQTEQGREINFPSLNFKIPCIKL